MVASGRVHYPGPYGAVAVEGPVRQNPQAPAVVRSLLCGDVQ